MWQNVKMLILQKSAFCAIRQRSCRDDRKSVNSGNINYEKNHLDLTNSLYFEECSLKITQLRTEFRQKRAAGSSLVVGLGVAAFALKGLDVKIHQDIGDEQHHKEHGEDSLELRG